MESVGSTQYIGGTNNKGEWVSVVIPGNVKEEDDAEEVGYGEVHHCCRVTDTVGWRTGECRTAQVHRVTGWVRLAMSEEMRKGGG